MSEMSDASNVRNGGMSRRVSEVSDLLLKMVIVPPAAATDFVGKLASEHDWTRDRAQRAYDEYVRFLLMAWISPDMVVPSHDVDQAWHLHLTHSRHYWDVLCGTILQRPFHHEPSLGGEHEDARHGDAYSRTLALYAYVFDEEAPHDVWPRGCTCGRTDTPKEVVLASSPFIPIALFGGVAAAIAWGSGYRWMALAIIVITVGIAAFVTSWERSEQEDYELRAERTRRDRAAREARTAPRPVEMDRAEIAAQLERARERTRSTSSSKLVKPIPYGSGRTRGGSSSSSRSSSYDRSGDDAGATFAAIMAADSASAGDSHSHGHSSHSSHSCSSSSSHSCSSSSSSHSCGSSSSSSCGGSSCGGSSCGSS
jgi:hypothetical protein